jgi:hypothetical protein
LCLETERLLTRAAKARRIAEDLSEADAGTLRSYAEECEREAALLPRRVPVVVEDDADAAGELR